MRVYRVQGTKVNLSTLNVEQSVLLFQLIKKSVEPIYLFYKTRKNNIDIDISITWKTYASIFLLGKVIVLSFAEKVRNQSKAKQFGLNFGNLMFNSQQAYHSKDKSRAR